MVTGDTGRGGGTWCAQRTRMTRPTKLKRPRRRRHAEGKGQGSEEWGGGEGTLGLLADGRFRFRRGGSEKSVDVDPEGSAAKGGGDNVQGTGDCTQGAWDGGQLAKPVGRATPSGAISAAQAGTVRPTLRKLRLLTLRPMEWELWGVVACNGALIRVHPARTGEQVV